MRMMTTDTSAMMPTERVFARVGQLVNLTCHFAGVEVDWHFKDTNLTTTVLAYAHELQVTKKVRVTSTSSTSSSREAFVPTDNEVDDLEADYDEGHRPSDEEEEAGGGDPGHINRSFEHDEHNDYDDSTWSETRATRTREPASRLNAYQLKAKYAVNSDKAMQRHVLSVLIEGSEDEGSYQCIDSNSDSPIKKNIYLFLSKTLLCRCNIF